MLLEEITPQELLQLEDVTVYLNNDSLVLERIKQFDSFDTDELGVHCLKGRFVTQELNIDGQLVIIPDKVHGYLFVRHVDYDRYIEQTSRGFIGMVSIPIGLTPNDIRKVCNNLE